LLTRKRGKPYFKKKKKKKKEKKKKTGPQRGTGRKKRPETILK